MLYNPSVETLPLEELRALQSQRLQGLLSRLYTHVPFYKKQFDDKGIHPNDVRSVIQAFLDKMIESLSSGDRLEFRDFGVFEVVQRKQKIGRNPKNASVPIVIPPRKVVKFTPGKKMREQIEQLKD